MQQSSLIRAARVMSTSIDLAVIILAMVFPLLAVFLSDGATWSVSSSVSWVVRREKVTGDLICLPELERGRCG